MGSVMYILLFILLLVAILFLLIFHWRKKKIIREICCMSSYYKCHLLNDLAKPFGYCYMSQKEIFTSTQDAWQKQYGYGKIYDRMAPFFNMIFDCQPVYFDYDGKTWLIEFWKGQYGINTGSEIGIYHADAIVPPGIRKRTIFHAATEEEYLFMNTELCERGRPLSDLGASHWWLTQFLPGHFSSPKNLTLEITIRFPDTEMRDAFLDALTLKGYDINHIGIFFTTVSFCFCSSPRQKCFLKKIYRSYVQLKNRLFCKLYQFVTRPFENTCDKVLYLYYYLPFVFRRMLRLHRFKKGENK